LRLTCLKCGHQFELATGPHSSRIPCVCGQDFTYPEVLNTGTQPSEAAAERSRSKAFRAAGLVKNIGAFALGIALLGVLFFPLGVVGACIGVYVLTMMRGPLGRYSGRTAAVGAVAIGISVFLAEGSLAMSYLKERQRQRLESFQAAADDDLRALLRAERLFRADNDTYGTFKEFRFTPRQGKYTLYLGPDDYIPANREREKIVDPLPTGVVAAVSEGAFTAVAVANIDGDPFLDVWTINDHGEVIHLQDDIGDTATPSVAAPVGPSVDSTIETPTPAKEVATEPDPPPPAVMPRPKAAPTEAAAKADPAPKPESKPEPAQLPPEAAPAPIPDPVVEPTPPKEAEPAKPAEGEIIFDIKDDAKAEP
jgi:hypothetical protein